MTFFLIFLIAAGWIGGLLLFAVPVYRRGRSTLPSCSADTLRPDRSRGRSVSVVIPARNEAQRIGALLASLTVQTLAPVEVIVVDDQSADATEAVAQAGGARVIPAGQRPDGWIGKSWACQVGAEAAIGDTILFLDADVTLADDAIERLLRALDESGGVVSVQPYHRTVRLYERFSALFNAQVVASIGVGPTARGLFGPCIMMAATTYARCGGHESVRGSIVDDIALGARCLDAGIPIRTFLGGRAVRFRMYPEGPRQMLSGWTKNFLQGADATPRLILFAQSMWIVGASTVAVQTIFSGAALPVGIIPLPAALIMYAFYSALLAVTLPHYGRFGAVTALLFPLHLVFFACVAAYALSVRIRGGSVNWRGRAVVVTPLGERRRNRVEHRAPTGRA
ncbi:MAG: glycosyltransferase [Spirochaetaceae bacterium]|nr:MAG: glycosyltransferase [Spirochaetaceae bacterium]